MKSLASSDGRTVGTPARRGLRARKLQSSAGLAKLVVLLAGVSVLIAATAVIAIRHAVIGRSPTGVASILGRSANPSSSARTASSTPSATPSSTTSQSPSLASVDWSSQQYPVACGGTTTGRELAEGTTSSGVQVAVVAVTCRAGAGSPPSAVLVYDNTGPNGAPNLRQTLLTYEDDWLVLPSTAVLTQSHFAVDVYGYSSSSVSRCCPDVRTTLGWTWNGSSYVKDTAEPPHSTLPY